MDIDRTAFGRETTATEVLNGLDLTGKRVLITGGSSGLGAEAARVFAAKGADVIITARNVEKAEPVIKAIQAETGSAVLALSLELGSFASIRSFAETFLARDETLDIVINNAGVMACPYAETDDGFEMQFGANHLGHFLMNNLIASRLNDKARVVCLSSFGHQMGTVEFEDIFFKQRPYEKWTAYGQSKTANALLAVGLNKRLTHRGIEAFAVHPGAIQTNLGRHMTDEDLSTIGPMMEKFGVIWKSIPQGAATEVYAATAPELAGHGGSYLANCAFATVSDDPEAFGETLVRSYALDDGLADRLWTVSEALVGQKFDH